MKNKMEEILTPNTTISPAIKQYIRDSLFKSTQGNAYIFNFVSKFLLEAKRDPNSKSGQLLARAIFAPDIIDQLDEEINKKINTDINFAEYEIRKTLYDKQQDVFDDRLDDVLLIINSRRTGKTELAGRLLAREMLRPGRHAVYINRSFDRAASQINLPLINALEAGHISYTGSVSGGRLDFNNGSWILIIGNNNAADVNKLRGEKLSLVIIDECGHQRHLRELTQEVIGPAMIDYADSKMVLIGTPPRTKTHFIHEMWNNNKIKKFHWTYIDNPFLPNRESVIEKACNLYGVSPDSNFIKREYLGMMDAYDSDALYIKKYSTEEAPRNVTYDRAWIGVDFGFEDKAAVVSVVSKDKRLFIVDCWSEAKQAISTIANEIVRQRDALQKNYNIAKPVQIITDTNELGATADLYKTYGLRNIFTAYKYNKDYALDQLSDWFSSNTIVVSKQATPLIEDAENMLWKRDEDTDKILHELDDEAYHGNAMFALLYVSRQFAYEVMGLVEENKPAKEFLTAKDYIADIQGVNLK